MGIDNYTEHWQYGHMTNEANYSIRNSAGRLVGEESHLATAKEYARNMSRDSDRYTVKDITFGTVKAVFQYGKAV